MNGSKPAPRGECVLHGTQGTRRVDGQPYIPPGCLAKRSQALAIQRNVEADGYLECAIPSRNESFRLTPDDAHRVIAAVVAHDRATGHAIRAAAQQPPERRGEELPLEIPQRQIDEREATGKDAALPEHRHGTPRRVPDRTDGPRGPADDEGRKVAHNCVIQQCAASQAETPADLPAGGRAHDDELTLRHIHARGADPFRQRHDDTAGFKPFDGGIKRGH